MNKTEQKKVLKIIKNFIVETLGEDAVTDMQFFTGDEGVKYCEYASEKAPYISFDGSPVYMMMNAYVNGW